MRLPRFHREARLEARAAATWYRQRSQEAARIFVALVAEGVRSIGRHPAAWPLWQGRPDVRQRVLSRIPFSLFYIAADDDIVIIAVAHQKLPPGYWLHRIDPGRP